MSSVLIFTANWDKSTRLDSSWLPQAFFDNHLFVKVGQLAGLDFYGNQISGASYVIEPLDFALGNLFTNTPDSECNCFWVRTQVNF